MNSKLAGLLILIGSLAFAGQIIHRLQRDSAFYSQQLQTQQQSIEDGLRSRWADYLLAQARAGKVPNTFSVRMSRDGQTLRETFFPRGLTADWASYRELKSGKNELEQISFLKDAMRTPGTWDRVLAIEEWTKELKQPLPVSLSPYEQTRTSKESSDAYSLIFEQIARKPDLLLVTTKAQFGKAFYRATGDGDIEVFIPSLKSVQPMALGFTAETAISELIVGSNPWDVRILRPKLNSRSKRLRDLGFLIASAGCFAAGIALYLLSIRREKLKVSSQVSFLNQVVHELKTPLTGLKLHAQLMRNYGPSPDSLEGLETSVNRMNQLFDDIVTINRPLSNVELVHVSAAKLNEMIQSIQKEAGDKASLRGEFIRDILTDAARLNLILRNLVRNAIKYGNFAEIKIEQSHTETRYEIKDRGEGIPVSEAEKIFQEFYRAEDGRRKTADGLGLGLSLAKKLSREIGMEIRLLNPGERNARFELSLVEKK